MICVMRQGVEETLLLVCPKEKVCAHAIKSGCPQLTQINMASTYSAKGSFFVGSHESLERKKTHINIRLEAALVGKSRKSLKARQILYLCWFSESQTQNEFQEFSLVINDISNLCASKQIKNLLNALV